MKLGSYIFHVKRIVDDDIVTYSSPTKYYLRFNYLTVMPATVALNNMAGYLTTEEYGEHNAMGWNIIANEKIFRGVFNEGDLLYLDGADEANAIITSVREQNKVIFMTVKVLEGE